MDWLETFKTDLMRAWDWTPPISSEELDARLNNGEFFKSVPDVLWAYACGHLSFEFDDDSPWENVRGNLNHQGSVGPGTAMAIPFVLQLARHLSDAPQADLLSDALWFGLGEQNSYLPWGDAEPEWILDQAEPRTREEEARWQLLRERFGDDPYHNEACYKSLKESSPIIREIGSSPTVSVQVITLWILAFLPEDLENIAFIRSARPNESLDVQRMAHLALAVTGTEVTSQEYATWQTGIKSSDDKTRLVSALALALTQLRAQESPQDEILEEICSADTNWHRADELFNFSIYVETISLVDLLLEVWEEKEPERVKAKRTPQN